MRCILVLLLCFAALHSHAQDLNLYEKHWFSSDAGRIPYRYLYPFSFDSSQKYPLIIFLHGAGGRGTDNESQLQIGARYFLQPANREKYPAIVLFPQCPATELWADFTNEPDAVTGRAARWQFPFHKTPSYPIAVLADLIDSLKKLAFVDKDRIYIGGLSQGAMGVFDIIARRPELFAAAFPVCGAGKVSTSKKFAGEVSLWIFHGADDDIVPVGFSRDFYKSLQKLSADVRYTEYPGVKHASWVPALAEPELLSWIFSKRKKG